MISNELRLFLNYLKSVELLYLSDKILIVFWQVVSPILLKGNVVFESKSIDNLMNINKEYAFDFFFAQYIHNIVQF